jgi:hypothetical protein
MIVKPARRWVLGSAAVTMAVVLGACGGGSSKSSTSGATTTLPAGVAQYVQCLQSHGVAASTSGALPESKATAAHGACASALPTRGAVDYRACLRAFLVAKPSEAKNDPHFAAASQACLELRKKSGSTTATT